MYCVLHTMLETLLDVLCVAHHAGDTIRLFCVAHHAGDTIRCIVCCTPCWRHY